MNNIVPFNRTSHPADTTPLFTYADQNPEKMVGSPILFTAYERKLYYKGKDDVEYDNVPSKALVRMLDGKPHVLNVVGENYKLIQNAELFDVVEQGVGEAMKNEIHYVKDKVSYGGTKCFREYCFPNVKVDSPERDNIVFRVIVENGFGTGAIKVHAGAIDMFCTNGMILGDYISAYGRHTSGLKIDKFQETVRKAVDVFWKNRELWTMMRDKKIKSDMDIAKWLNTQFGERLGARLYHQYTIEQRTRGGANVWALYSALTYYSSHNSGTFPMRETGNDHAASTMLRREYDVRKATQTSEWKGLLAA